MRLPSLVMACLWLIARMLPAQGEIEKLSAAINSPDYDESSPVISSDGKQLFFTRTAYPEFESTMKGEDGFWGMDQKDDQYAQRLSVIYSQIAGRDIPDPYQSVLNQDIWVCSISSDTIYEPRHPGYPLNSGLPNSLVSTGMSPHEYVLLNEFYEDGSMFAGFSRIQMGESEVSNFPQPMYIYGFEVHGSDVNMTMTPNGHVVILSMEGPESQGGKDFYVSFFMRDNVWSTPVHMGEVLNSAFQETTPYISPDKRFLYFSSNRPGGVGGNDIYVSERLDYTWLHWSAPKLVPGDVNSVYDDSHPYFDPARHFLYFSSRRDGSSDIFRQHLLPKPKLKRPILIRGRILNSKTKQLVRGEVFWGPQSSREYLEYFNSYNGEFEVTLTEFEPYKFQLRKPNHIAQRILLDPRGIESQGKDTLDVIFYLDPKSTDEQPAETEPVTDTPLVNDLAPEIGTRPISFYQLYFVKGKTELLRRSENALLDLLLQMNRHPEMRILITGHTDNVGDQEDLMDLSVRRAEKIKAYLVTQGIRAARMEISGAGPADPVSQNATETGREKNRRVEIRIIRE